MRGRGTFKIALMSFSFRWVEAKKKKNAAKRGGGLASHVQCTDNLALAYTPSDYTHTHPLTLSLSFTHKGNGG